jgi:hypothetical protein
MAAELIVAPEAENDVIEAYAWYENRRVGLGEDFLTSVDACIQSIRRAPERYPVIQESYRRGLVRRFPYAVFFEFLLGTVQYSVSVTSRATPRSGASAFPDSRRTGGNASAGDRAFNGSWRLRLVAPSALRPIACDQASLITL